MQSLPSVSVCFPAYNEEATIADVLSDAHKLLSSAGLDYEIIVCNDASTDKTKSIIEKFTSNLPNFRLINNSQNLGINKTFELLYSEAKKEFVFLNSTDQQWKTSILFEMLPLTKEWDIVIARRKNKHYGIIRSVVSFIFNLVPQFLFGVRTFDAGAVKIVRREIIQRLPLVSISPFSEAERLIRASREGYKIIEYPVDILPRKTGKSKGIKPGVYLNVMRDIFCVWHDMHFKKIRSKYDVKKST
jgi:glycosyltransferase involved in cell wall biosynthesis